MEKIKLGGNGGGIPPLPIPVPRVGNIPALPIGGNTPAVDGVLVSAEQQIPRTMCWYGATRTWKTTQAAELALYWYEKTGLPSRYFTNEMTYDHIQKYIDAGILKVFPMDTSIDNPLALVRAVMSGGWLPFVSGPNGVLNLTPPRIKMGKDSQGRPTRTMELQEPIAMIIVEGLSSITDRCMRYMAAQPSAEGKYGAGATKVQSMMSGMGDTVVAGATMSDYGNAQGFCLTMIEAFASLPVKMILFTAHEGKGKDEQGNVNNGIAVVGKAAGKLIPPKVGDLFHFEVVGETAKTLPGQAPSSSLVLSHRAYYERHPDPDYSNVLWPAGVRFPKEKMHLLKEKFPGGYIDLEKNSIVDYMRLREKVETQEINDLLKWKSEQDEKFKSKREEQLA